jgi:hypothetical protein
MDGWDGVAVGDPGEARPCHLIDSHFHLGTWESTLSLLVNDDDELGCVRFGNGVEWNVMVLFH